MIIGLTGGIACGKSSVAGFISESGAQVISTDGIGHDLLLQGSSVFEQIAAISDTSLLDDLGNISRKKLGEIVFSDSAKRERLNSLIHPEIRQRWKSQVATIIMTDKRAIVFVEIPLLYETGEVQEFDRVVCVASSRQTQIARLETQRHLTREQAVARINAQMAVEKKADLSDYVIWNEYGLSQLKSQVSLLLEKIALVEQADN